MTKVSDDLRSTPFWWDGTDLAGGIDANASPLPGEVDVAIVGAGLSGLAAARVLARSGRSVLVLDAKTPGGGASSRNGAMLGRYLKHSFGQMKEDAGLDTAVRYFKELVLIYDRALERMDEIGSDCGFRNCGRVVGAITAGHRDRLFREWELRSKHVGEAVNFIDRPGHAELPTDRYVGGIHIVDNAAIHPGRYSQAFVRAARDAGAAVIGDTPVDAISRDGASFVLSTPKGSLKARDVLVTTNGYTQKSQSWFFKRLSPIDAFMIATEPLDRERFKSLLTHNRTYHDNRKNSNYYQFSEDGRLVFGGRTGLLHRSPQDVANKLRREMLHFFPELESAAITHAWQGRCAATDDLLPHVGQHDGIHFAIGYCFSGLAMAPYLGEKAAARILGDKSAAETLFVQDDLRHVAWPKRQSWLIPVAMHYWRMQEPLPRR